MLHLLVRLCLIVVKKPTKIVITESEKRGCLISRTHLTSFLSELFLYIYFFVHAQCLKKKNVHKPFTFHGQCKHTCNMQRCTCPTDLMMLGRLQQLNVYLKAVDTTAW